MEKQEGCGVVAHERLTEPRVTMVRLLAKPRNVSYLPAFLDINGTILLPLVGELASEVFWSRVFS